MLKLNRRIAAIKPSATLAADARALMSDQLKAAGFSAVTMLSKAPLPSEAADQAPRVVAA